MPLPYFRLLGNFLSKTLACFLDKKFNKPDVPIQSQIESPSQINPTEIIQTQGHYDHGVNLDNLDPNLV